VHRRISFIKSSTLRLKNEERIRKKEKYHLDGEEVKSFYESIVSSNYAPDAEFNKDSNDVCSLMPSGVNDSVTNNITLEKIHCRQKPGKTLANRHSPYKKTVHTPAPRPIQSAVTVRQSEVISLKSSHCTSKSLCEVRGVSNWLRCVEAGRVSELAGYLKLGQDLDVRDMHGWTALMVAAHAGKKGGG